LVGTLGVLGDVLLPTIETFSDGPAICPARHLVLMLTSAMLAELFAGAEVRLKSHPRFASHRPLPATLNHFALRFDVR
jgi:hypothetical protein